MSLVYLSVIALVAVSLTWGGSYLVVKDLLENLSPVQYLSIRYALATPLITLLFWKKFSNWIKTLTWPKLKSNITPGLWLGASFILQAIGIQSSGPGKAAVLTALVFIYVPIIEILLGKKQGLREFMPFLLTSTIGIVFLSEPWSIGWRMPDILLVVCAIGFASHIYLTSTVVQSNHFSVVFIVQGLVVFLLSSFIWYFLEDFSLSDISTKNWIRIFYVAVVVTAMCYLMQFYAQKYVQPHYVALIFALEPVSAILFSILLGYESLTANMIIGSLFILLTVLVVIIKGKTGGLSQVTT